MVHYLKRPPASPKLSFVFVLSAISRYLADYQFINCLCLLGSMLGELCVARPADLITPLAQETWS